MCSLLFSFLVIVVVGCWCCTPPSVQHRQCHRLPQSYAPKTLYEVGGCAICKWNIPRTKCIAIMICTFRWQCFSCHILRWKQYVVGCMNALHPKPFAHSLKECGNIPQDHFIEYITCSILKHTPLVRKIMNILCGYIIIWIHTFASDRVAAFQSNKTRCIFRFGVASGNDGGYRWVSDANNLIICSTSYTCGMTMTTCFVLLASQEFRSDRLPESAESQRIPVQPPRSGIAITGDYLIDRPHFSHQCKEMSIYLRNRWP